MRSEEHKESLKIGPGASGLLATFRWLVETLLSWQGCNVNFEHVRGLRLTPRTCVPLGTWDLGLGHTSGLDVVCPEAPLSESMA